MFDQVKQLLMTKFEVPERHINDQATLTDLELDSLDVVEFAEIVTDQLGAEISDDEVFELERLDKIVALIESRGVRAS